MIRRKSDAARTIKDCAYLRTMQHDAANQARHQQRQTDRGHDQYAACWCCCDDCTDLNFHHEPRKGVWWAVGSNGELRSMRETYAGSPGSAETNPS